MKAPLAGQPKDPDQALLAGRPLMFTGEDEEGGCLALGHPSNIVLLVQEGNEYDEAQLGVGALAAAVKERWNLHHDYRAALLQLLPFAEEELEQRRRLLRQTQAFAQTCTPRVAAQPQLQLRQGQVQRAEAAVNEAHRLLAGEHCGTYQVQGEDPREGALRFRCDGCGRAGSRSGEHILGPTGETAHAP